DVVSVKLSDRERPGRERDMRPRGGVMIADRYHAAAPVARRAAEPAVSPGGRPRVAGRRIVNFIEQVHVAARRIATALDDNYPLTARGEAAGHEKTGNAGSDYADWRMQQTKRSRNGTYVSYGHKPPLLNLFTYSLIIILTIYF